MMKFKEIVIILIIMVMALPEAGASPARRSSLTLTQPDGTTFRARLRGDEFLKIITTEDGTAIIQDEDGWWSYAYYNEKGEKFSSGHRVGTAVTRSVKSTGRNIPYEALAELAVQRRALAPAFAAPSMASGLGTKSDTVTDVGTGTDDGTGDGTDSGGSSGAAAARRHGLILLVAFRDLEFTYSQSDFQNLMEQGRGGSGGAVQYFNDQFAGTYEFSFNIVGPVSLANSYRYYGANTSTGNDIRPEQMVKEACELADSQVDFSEYDDDGDGVVDNVFVLFAGPDEADGAGDNYIWSHAWYLEGGAGITLTLDGVQIDRYACTSELSQGQMTGIGTFCHEYSHTFGLPDLYDTDYEASGGLADALWTYTSLMDAGNMNNDGNTPPYFNAIEREILGLSTPETITEEGYYRLKPINESGQCYRFDTDVEGEYYLLECRSGKGWDSWIGGSGLLIYHIDKSQNYSGNRMTAAQRWDDSRNSVNCNPSHQCADLIEPARPASTEPDGTNTFLQALFYPYGEITTFTPYTTPAFTFWSGTASDFKITNIERDGDDITFLVTKTAASSTPTPIITRTDIFQTAVIVSWSVDESWTGPSYIEWNAGSSQSRTAEVAQYAPGRYAMRLEGLNPSTQYNITLWCGSNAQENKGKTVSKTFNTRTYIPGNKPYMYLRYVERNDDYSFPEGAGLPLILYNVTDAADITWTMDGREVVPGADGYYTPTAGGMLKATVTYKDGTTDVVAKEIIVRNE